MSNIERIFNNLKLDLDNDKLKGKITITLAEIDCIITGKDGVGTMLQEWFFDWAKINGYNLEKNPETNNFQIILFRRILEIKVFWI